MKKLILNCPLCQSNNVNTFSRSRGRKYLQCKACDLVYLSPEYRPDPMAEYLRYTTHNNDPHDIRYRNFLNRLKTPLVKKLKKASQGLDFGCGPGPTLSIMLEEEGFMMNIYDPFFASDPQVLQYRYDFITCTEAIEHFYYPQKEFYLLNNLLNVGGWLGIMTDIFYEDIDFNSWYYPKDITHATFYSLHTINWIAENFGWKWESPRRNVILFQKMDSINSKSKMG